MMKRASRIAATVLGLFAGGASVEHGIYEILQGNLRPEGLMISSMGPPCQPEAVWHNCEPALTILPNFLVTGILAVTVLTSLNATDVERLRAFLARMALFGRPARVREHAWTALGRLQDGFREWLGPTFLVAVDPESGREYRWEDVVVFEDAAGDRRAKLATLERRRPRFVPGRADRPA